MQKPLVHAFTDNRSYLQAYYRYRKQAQRSFCYKSWANELGLKNPGYLCNAVNGKRTLKAGLIERMVERLELSENEENLLRARALIDNGKEPSETVAAVKDVVEALTFQARNADEDEFLLIKEWQHLALLEMVELNGFRPDPEWIAACLGGKLSAFEVEMALKRLVRNGYLVRSAEGFVKTERNLLIAPKNRSSAIQEYHRASIELAKDALKLPLERREFNTCTIPIRIERIDEVRRLAQEFVARLLQLAEKSENTADCLMRVNLHAFSLCEIPNPTKEEDT